MRRVLPVAAIVISAACAPAPAVLLKHLRRTAADATIASAKHKQACAPGVHGVPFCAVLDLCLARLQTTGQACKNALVIGATSKGEAYAATANRCTDARSVAEFVCATAGVRSEDPHGHR